MFVTTILYSVKCLRLLRLLFSLEMTFTTFNPSSTPVKLLSSLIYFFISAVNLSRPRKSASKLSKSRIYFYLFSDSYLSRRSDGSPVSNKLSRSSLSAVCFHILGLSWQSLFKRIDVENIKVANMAWVQTRLMDSVRLPAPMWISSVTQRGPQGPFPPHTVLLRGLFGCQFSRLFY